MDKEYVDVLTAKLVDYGKLSCQSSLNMTWTRDQRNNVFPYDCPCDIGSDGGLPTIKAQVSLS